MKKTNGETNGEFNKIFNKIYNKIPQNIKASQAAAKVTYVGAYEAEFSMILREKRFPTLLSMQYYYLGVEGNMTTLGKLKHRKSFDKKKPKDEVVTSSKNNENQDEKIEEISRILRGLSNKLTKLEVEGDNGNINP